MPVKINGKEVVSSATGLWFTVEARDIRNGQPNDPCGCAAARALLRATGAEEVRVYRNKTYVIHSEGKPRRYDTPADLRIETIAYDRGGEFYPGKYRLAAGTAKAASSKAKSGSGPRKSRVTHVTRHTIPNVRPSASERFGGDK